MDKLKMKEFGKKVKKEAFINSILSSLIVSFSIAFITSMVFWLAKPKLFWMSIVLFGISFISGLPIFYFAKYKPTEEYIAKRIDDAINSDERIITAIQFASQDSFILKRQREDAKAFIKNKSSNLLKIVTSVPLIILCTTAFILGGGMTTVSGLTAAGYVKSGSEIIEDMDRANKKVFEVKYKTCYFDMSTSNNNFFFEQDENKPCGEIIGASEQVVTEGEDAEEVMAVAYDGYAFYAWSDGLQNPVRIDYKVQGELTITALFTKIDEDGDPDKDGKPSDEDAEPDDGKDGEPGSNQDGSGNKDGENTDSKSDSRNQVLDGKTYYGGKTYEEARNDASDKASKDGNMPDSIKKLINDYFDAIKKN